MGNLADQKSYNTEIEALIYRKVIPLFSWNYQLLVIIPALGAGFLYITSNYMIGDEKYGSANN